MVRRQRTAELRAVQGVLTGRMPAEFGGAQGTPGDAEAGLVQTAERAAQTGSIGQQVFFRHEHVVHDDFAGQRSAEREFTFDLRRRQALHALFQDEAPDHAVELGPDDEDVGDGGVGNPHFVAGQDITAIGFFRAGLHAARIGAMVRFGQPEGADELTRGEARQIFHALFFRAIGIDRIHHQRRLDAERRPITGIDMFDRARDQAVANVVDAGAAVLFGNGRAEEAEFTHFIEDFTVERFIAERFQHPRHQLVLGVGMGGFGDHALVLGQLTDKIERVFPIELGFHLFGVGGFG